MPSSACKKQDRRRPDQVPQPDRAAGLQLNPRSRFRSRVMGNPHGRIERDLAKAHRLEGDVERHHLGQGGRVKPCIGIARVENFSGPRVDHHGRIGGSPRRGGCGKKRAEQHCEAQKDRKERSSCQETALLPLLPSDAAFVKG